jgi:hypothetical protein
MATIQTINIGASANDNTGDPLRTAFDKTNQNNTALNNDLAAKQVALDLKAPIASPTFTGTLTAVNDAIINGIKVGTGGGSYLGNTVIGNNSLIANTSGIENTSIGYSSQNKTTIGDNNISLGGYSLFSNTIGNSNTAIGLQTLYDNVSGSANTAIGYNALGSTLTDDNTALGHSAGDNNINYSRITCIGYNSQVTGSSQNQIGSADTTTYVYGTVQNRSDLRDKADVQDTVLGLDFISKLRPVDYKWDMREDYKSELPIQGELSEEDFKVVMDLWIEENKLVNLKNDGTKKRNRYHHGFIAQEVRDLGIDFGGFQDHSINGGEDVLSIGYDEFIAPMIKAIQELKAEIELLKSK